MGMFSQGGRAHQFKVQAQKAENAASSNNRPLSSNREDSRRANATPPYNKGRSAGEQRASDAGPAVTPLQLLLKSFSLPPAAVFRRSSTPAAVGAGVSSRTETAESDFAGASFPDRSASTLAVVKVNDELPILKHRSEIERAVMLSDYSLIVGETGSGKSLATPEFLQALGFRVNVLQPRRIAASSLAERLSEIKGTELGGEVGFRHGLRSQRSPDTEILYTTFGSQFRSELRNPSDEKTVLIFDEFHELSAEAEFFLGYLRMQREETGKGPRVVIMSATMDSARLSEFLGGAPIVHVEGRRFPIEIERGRDQIANDVVRGAEAGRSSLVFLYGKSAIAEETLLIERHRAQVKVLPFHSGLSAQEQAKVFKTHEVPIAVLGTNIGQTSITIPGIQDVYLSGKVRRNTIVDGDEALIIDDISHSEAMQQMGRVGRTQPGRVISYAADFSKMALDIPAELQNIRVDGLYLQTQASGHSFRRINRFCYNPASNEQISEARQRLMSLGMLGPRGHVTELGRFVADLPVEPHLGKIIFSARKAQADFGSALMERAIDMAAVASGEVFAREGERSFASLLGVPVDSEVIAQAGVLNVFLRQGAEGLAGIKYDMAGLERALAHRAKIRERLDLAPGKPSEGELSQGTLVPLRSALCSGFIDGIFRLSHIDESSGTAIYRHIIRGGEWKLSKDSFIHNDRFVVGRPKHIEFIDSQGHLGEISLITMTTPVSSKWFRTNLPRREREVIKEEMQKERHNESREKKIEHQREFHRPTSTHGRGRR